MIHGGGGAIGGAVARTLASEGAHVFPRLHRAGAMTGAIANLSCGAPVD